MKIYENWEITRNGDCFTLTETYKSDHKKSKTGFGKNEYYYGTLYQTLQGFLVKASQEENNKTLIESINMVLDRLLEAKEEIKKEFRTEVKVMR